jgi:uncharacterized repeat protein (TIGR03803 family)
MRQAAMLAFRFTDRLLFGAFAIFLASAPNPVAAHWRFKLIYSFASGTQQIWPSGLIMDNSGNLYGTAGGGASNKGIVFEVAPDGNEQTLYSFCSTASCADGEWPLGGVIIDEAGNLYGTTLQGGQYGFGTVFKLASNGNETVLYSFGSPNYLDGTYPASGVIRDAAGNLYGTTSMGGSGTFPGGTIFELTPSGTETILYDFCSSTSSYGADGCSPFASLIMDGSGDLYGTAAEGGNDVEGETAGIAFVLTAGTERTLYTFCSVKISSSCADGANPVAPLVRDEFGNLYGTAFNVVFELPVTGGETVLYHFCSLPNCTDGIGPVAGLLRRADGALFGTTSGGGATGGGTVFEITPEGRERVIHNFCLHLRCRDGGEPMAPLIMDQAGDLYGTTLVGGALGWGTVFELVRD